MSAVTLSVPKGTSEFTLTYGGLIDQPQTYKPGEAGTVLVQPEHLAEFLRLVPGAKPASAAAETEVENLTEQQADTAGAAGAQSTPRRPAPPR